VISDGERSAGKNREEKQPGGGGLLSAALKGMSRLKKIVWGKSKRTISALPDLQKLYSSKTMRSILRAEKNKKRGVTPDK